MTPRTARRSLILKVRNLVYQIVFRGFSPSIFLSLWIVGGFGDWQYDLRVGASPSLRFLQELGRQSSSPPANQGWVWPAVSEVMTRSVSFISRWSATKMVRSSTLREDVLLRTPKTDCLPIGHTAITVKCRHQHFGFPRMLQRFGLVDVDAKPWRGRHAY